MGGLVTPVGPDQETAGLVGEAGQAVGHHLHVHGLGQAEHPEGYPRTPYGQGEETDRQAGSGPRGPHGDRTVATNRRARREYEFLETFEGGIVLQGSEVKSLREGKAQISEAYARVDDGEMWLFQIHIPPWQFATGVGAHDPDRKRKLLLHRGQIDELVGKTQQQSLTLIPASSISATAGPRCNWPWPRAGASTTSAT